MAETVAGIAGDAPQEMLVVPVPLHRSKYRQRGFNQARALAQKIEFVLDEAEELDPRGMADMEITVGGTTHALTARSFAGAPSDPLDFGGAAAKFRRFTRSMLTEREQSEFIDRVARLERLSKVRPLAKLLRNRWKERANR